MGVKYCFRYNARNRLQRQDENGEPIDLTTMPPRHRRRREKKLMTMDEVNGRFPLTKYKAWISSRADQGLSTAGGVTVSASRAASIKGAEGVIPPYQEISSDDNKLEPKSIATVQANNESDNEICQAKTLTEATVVGNKTKHALPETEAKTLTNSSPGDTTTREIHENEDDMDDDEQIQNAVPTEMLANPGDSCAICLDTLDDDDDVRGLSCGHAFHASCIDPWLTSRRACCPLCKADYYVPKPRPEGETVTDADRAGRRPGMNGGRIDMPGPPPFAFIGRGGAPFRPRMVLPGRFMTVSYAEGHDRYGFPTVQRLPRFSRRQHGENHNGPDSPLAGVSPDTSTQRNAQRSRFRIPNMGNWRRNRNNATASNQAPEIGTPTANPTPGQLEAGSQ